MFKLFVVDVANTPGPLCQCIRTHMSTQNDQHANITIPLNQDANIPGSTYQHSTKMTTHQDPHANTPGPTCNIHIL